MSACDRYTLVVESRDGRPIPVETFRRLVQGDDEVEVVGWAPGDHLPGPREVDPEPEREGR